MSGRALIKDTRVLAETIIEEAELGESAEDIHENYPSVPIETIRTTLASLRHTRHNCNAKPARCVYCSMKIFP